MNRQTAIPRGLRNNNPGNIRLNGDKWKGMRPHQEDKDFVQFTSPSYGYRAIMVTLRNYRIKYGIATLSDMIRRWAPPCENNTAAYIKAVCTALQVPSDYVPDVYDRTTMCALAAAISRHENGREAIMEDVEAGWELL